VGAQGRKYGNTGKKVKSLLFLARAKRQEQGSNLQKVNNRQRNGLTSAKITLRQRKLRKNTRHRLKKGEFARQRKILYQQVQRRKSRSGKGEEEIDPGNQSNGDTLLHRDRFIRNCSLDIKSALGQGAVQGSTYFEMMETDWRKQGQARIQ